jgi:TATA-binding protein-associated factor
MRIQLEPLLTSLDNNEFNLFARQGAIELVHCLVEHLPAAHLIPFIVLLIVPVLKRMCDLDWHVRSVAAQCFAALVKLYPLAESSASTTTVNALDEISAKNEALACLRVEQQDFLDQLMDNRKLKAYIVPSHVLIDVKLRPYQQQGVNWLAFLKKFNLHGILCDDMGLGKTIQSICMLAGDQCETGHQATDSNALHNDEDKFRPSLIVCPSTLTNHWYHEIDRFVEKTCLRPFIYSGTPVERESLRKRFFTPPDLPVHKRPNVFIVSYDIIRQDIQFIARQAWSYCILDEGHLIKSSKSKLSRAIRQVRAAHRLILTGTPIQNSVCELWCLFDFLLPGYLGTEKQFYAKYAKYVQSSAGAFQQRLERATSVAQDGTMTASAASSNGGVNDMGVLALESLHKQVLPFLLRRTKEEVINYIWLSYRPIFFCNGWGIKNKRYF